MKAVKVLMVLVAFVGMNVPEARAEATRVTNPSAINLEVLGRGLLYSISFDRVLNDDLAAGIGFGTTTLNNLDGTSSGVSTALIPVYINYYFMRDAGSLFVTGGATIVGNSSGANGLKANFSGLQFNSTPVLPTFGLGYENRGDSGFLFRVTGYGIIGQTLAPWVGFTLGYAF
jgi:hypothetical protein